MNMPMRGMDPGAKKIASSSTVRGKSSFVSFGTGRGS